MLVGPPDERELRRIITEPAARVGLRVEPALVDLVVAEVRDRPGRCRSCPPPWSAPGSTATATPCRWPPTSVGGGVGAALTRVGEEAWAAFDDDAQRAACRRLLLRLAVNENGSWVRRWARRAELVRPDDPAAAAALAVLTARRLVVARADDLGIAHEALLTGWPRLHGWLEDGRARADVRERLAIAATAWEEADRDPAELYRGTRLQAALDLAAASPDDLTPLERGFLAESADEADRQLAEQRARADREARGRRRARLVAGVLAVVLAFAASAGGYAVTQQRRAVQRPTRPTRAGSARWPGPVAPTTGRCCSRPKRSSWTRRPHRERPVRHPAARGRGGGHDARPHQVQAIAFTPDSRSMIAVTTSGDLVRWPADGGPGASCRTSRRLLESSRSTASGRRRPDCGRAGRPHRRRRLLPARPVQPAADSTPTPSECSRRCRPTSPWAGP